MAQHPAVTPFSPRSETRSIDAPTIVDAKDERVEDPASRRVASLLAGAFPSLASADLRAIANASSWFSVAGGTCVFHQGDESDAIYVVVSGMLGTYQVDRAGREKLLGLIGAGEIVGEMGFITGEPRTASIKALRNCELLRVSKIELQDSALRHPTVLMELCSTVVRRLRKTQEHGPAAHHSKTFCIVPHDPGLDTRMLAEQLVKACGNASKPLIVSRADGEGKTADWFSERERDHGVIVYLAEPQAATWTRFCLRQADCVILLARGQAAARPFSALEPTHKAIRPDIPVHLILHWSGAIESSKTADWLNLIRPRGHCHVRSSRDYGRAARLITGRSIGLVLSGGGARGLAHVGVVRALQEHGIEIDAIGGTSMGAFIGAALALGWDLMSMTKQCVDSFLSWGRLSDFAVLRSALFSPRKIERLFDEWFGDTGIEATPVKYFCTSTNLTSGKLSVHTAGRIATWVRASAAIPGVFPPVVNGGALHVDGGVLDNLPVDAMRQVGVGSIIAVNVASEKVLEHQVPGMLELLWRVSTIGSDSKAGSEHRHCDVMIAPDVQHIGLLSWRAYPQAIEAGYRAAIDQLPDLGDIAGWRMRAA